MVGQGSGGRWPEAAESALREAEPVDDPGLQNAGEEAEAGGKNYSGERDIYSRVGSPSLKWGRDVIDIEIDEHLPYDDGVRICVGQTMN